VILQQIISRISRPLVPIRRLLSGLPVSRYRKPFDEPLPKSGADNEVWSFGEDVYEILKDLLRLRERLRPYIHEIMKAASEHGIPALRPMFLEYPQDPICETIEDQFMFGPEILWRPCYVRVPGPESIFADGVNWLDAWNGETHAGGMFIDAPLRSKRSRFILNKAAG